MRVIAWNCRGCGKLSTVQHLLSLIEAEKPDIVFLSETKKSATKIDLFIKKLGFPSSFSIPSRNKAGGLCLLWNKNVNIDIISSCKYVIYALITPPKGVSWKASFFYGSPYAELKERSWKKLEHLDYDHDTPWMIMGDLNVIFKDEDKDGGDPFNPDDVDFANKLIQDTGLIDIGFTGNPYTWSNGREGKALIRQRLDRCLANAHWLLNFPNARIVHLTRTQSDHCPLLLDFFPATLKSPKPFKFQAMWLSHPSYKDTVVEAWTKSTSRIVDKILPDKLVATKNALISWNKKTFGNIFHQKSVLLAELDSVQCLDSNPLSYNLEKDLHDRLNSILKDEEIFWKQQSCDKWVDLGDKNTKFFHATTVCRRNWNKIVNIEGPDGTLVFDKPSIANIFVNYFSDMFCEDDVDSLAIPFNLVTPVINSLDNTKLIKIPSPDEIREALFSIGNFKAPGPDGFPSIFYKNSWDITSPSLISLIQNFFVSGHSLEHIGFTNIALIPKNAIKASPKDFRPISLCNIPYKIIAKILASRLKPLLHKIISPLQGAYVKGRQISDNIIIAHEILHSIRTTKRKHGLMAIKLDMSKAFDRISWTCLLSMLSTLGFESSFCNLIEKCIESPTFSVLLNGSWHNPISSVPKPCQIDISNQDERDTI